MPSGLRIEPGLPEYEAGVLTTQNSIFGGDIPALNEIRNPDPKSERKL
jgi:hypothetical protein